MTVKTFRVDWYPSAALIDFAKLKPNEAGVAIQIINLIYCKNGPIEYDLDHIRNLCNCRPSTCAAIIDTLIEKNVIQVLDDGKLSQKRCVIELENVNNRRNSASKSGEIGAVRRWRVKPNQ